MLVSKDAKLRLTHLKNMIEDLYMEIGNQLDSDDLLQDIQDHSILRSNLIGVSAELYNILPRFYKLLKYDQGSMTGVSDQDERDKIIQSWELSHPTRQSISFLK